MLLLFMTQFILHPHSILFNSWIFNLPITYIGRTFRLAIPLLPPYYRLTSLHHNYPSPNLTIPYI